MGYGLDADGNVDTYLTSAGELLRERVPSGCLMTKPVSLAGLLRLVAAQIRVGPVYTPPRWRGRGFGAAVTAAVSQAALDTGADHVLLFTDLANPTSNTLYQRLGYRPVTDRVVLEFQARR
jgi:predicted GNAT family acetyltransferase